MVRIIDKIIERRKRFRKLQVPLSSSVVPLQGNDPTESGDDKNSILPQGWFYSFEFFPPATEAGLDNLLIRIDRMARRLDPLFINVTWGSEGSTAVRSLAIASHAQKYLGVDVLLHLTTVGATRELLARALDQAKTSGVRNILALRGDPPRGQRTWTQGDTSGGECDRAVDLVKLIKYLHAEYFCIAVAGHPEGHPASFSQEDEMIHLREKIEAGADLIMTQFFYDTDVFLDFVRRCRANGITCPIIPGIMPIQSYSSFQRMTEYCNVAVPERISRLIEPVKHDDEAVKNIGCDIAAEMCRSILSANNTETLGVLDGVHFYTLNLERSVTQILLSMGAVDFIDQRIAKDNSGLFEGVRTSAGRALPWRQSAIENRSKREQVRPINWANRPKSYVMRTEDWDEFPNGRWGDSTSPAFGELSNMGHFYLFSLGSEEDQRAMLGENPKDPLDIFEVFARYVEGRIPHIPWCETVLQPESFLIQDQLASLNRSGFLTINSQPAVNGVPSTDKTFGWGGPGGYVYQKSYCECFCSPENASKLAKAIKRHESMVLYGVNVAGEELRTGSEPGGVTALTWGVFPNREIVQPTIFDPSTFLVWAEEAFALWTSMWLNLYDVESDSYGLIEGIRDSYFLCAIINNDYVSECNGKETIWNVLESARHEGLAS